MDHPQVLEWLLDVVTRMRPRPCSSIFPGRRASYLEKEGEEEMGTSMAIL